jgi:hypothetical protein
MVQTNTTPSFSSTVATHRCAIEECPIEISRSQLMCPGHWRLVPRPIQQEIYSVFRKRRGGPTHRAAIARAIATVRKTLDGWAAHRAAKSEGEPGWLPYRDD